MIVQEVINEFGFELVTNAEGSEKEILDVYIGDLLSWVMGNASQDCAWITIHGHINIVAVALLINASCIIVVEDATINENTIEKANSESIPIFRTKLSHYTVAKKFFEKGL